MPQRSPHVAVWSRIPHKVKGESIYAFITLTDEGNVKGANDETKKSLIAHVRKQIGAFAAPDTIHWAPGLPKTRCVGKPSNNYTLTAWHVCGTELILEYHCKPCLLIS